MSPQAWWWVTKRNYLEEDAMPQELFFGPLGGFVSQQTSFLFKNKQKTIQTKWLHNGEADEDKDEDDNEEEEESEKV